MRSRAVAILVHPKLRYEHQDASLNATLQASVAVSQSLLFQGVMSSPCDASPSNLMACKGAFRNLFA